LIGQIRGELKERLDQQLLIDVSGIGYEVDVPSSVLLSGLAIGDTVTLHTHFVVREDAHILFGFLDRTARDLFRALIKVNKVGRASRLVFYPVLMSARLSPACGLET